MNSDQTVLQDSYMAVLLTSIEYVCNDLRKKWKQFMMGVLAVFLTVSFITFLAGVSALGPIATIKQSIYHAGDFDIMIRGHTGSKPLINSNRNYYVDENEFFGAKYLSETEKSIQIADQTFKSKIPLMNFTRMVEIIDEVYTKKGIESPMNIFPRWVAQSTLVNPNKRSRNTTAHMVAGDSYLERKINVAPEFPKTILN